MQQQLQQHPSWEAAVGSRAPDLGPFEVAASCNSGDQLGDRPSSLVREGLALTPAEPRVMSARMPLQGE